MNDCEEIQLVNVISESIDDKHILLLKYKQNAINFRIMNKTLSTIIVENLLNSGLLPLDIWRRKHQDLIKMTTDKKRLYRMVLNTIDEHYSIILEWERNNFPYKKMSNKLAGVIYRDLREARMLPYEYLFPRSIEYPDFGVDNYYKLSRIKKSSLQLIDGGLK